MSAISSAGAYTAPYSPTSLAATRNNPVKTESSATKAPTVSGHDPDHDGDTDGPGLDVNG